MPQKTPKAAFGLFGPLLKSAKVGRLQVIFKLLILKAGVRKWGKPIIEINKIILFCQINQYKFVGPYTQNQQFLKKVFAHQRKSNGITGQNRSQERHPETIPPIRYP